MRSPLLAIGLLIVALTGCGDAPDRPRADPFPTSLVATSPSGAEIVHRFDRVVCAPSQEDPTIRTVQARGGDGIQFVEVRAVPHDAPATYPVPIGPAPGRAPAPVSITVSDEDHLVAADERVRPGDGGAGTVEVLEATCEPARLKVRVSSVLGSSVGQGEALSVQGGVDLNEEEPAGGVPNELRFYGGFHDGSALVPTDGLTCRASRTDPATDRIRLRVDGRGEDLFELSVAPVDEPTTYDLPVDRDRFWLRYSSETEVAATDTAAGDRFEPGQVEVLEASCEPLALRFRIDGALGNEGGATRRHLIALGGVSLPTP